MSSRASSLTRSLANCVPAVDFVIEPNDSSLEECEVNKVDGGAHPEPPLAGRLNPAQGDFARYDPLLASPVVITDTSQNADVVETPPGSGGSQLSAYSHANYPGLGFEIPESPISARRLSYSSSSPRTPNFPSSIPYTGSHANGNEANRRSHTFSPSSPRQALLAPREAHLLRYYIDKIAPWVMLQAVYCKRHCGLT